MCFAPPARRAAARQSWIAAVDNMANLAYLH
jgi:hypothetical protein